jgi:hypothetical protein
VEPGARLFWSPTGGIAVSIDNTTGDIITDSEALIANGRLLEIYGKDIQILEGDYVEGEHYTVRRVDALNQRVEGGVITVTGIPDEGIISVTLAGPVYGNKGPIGVTLLPSVLTGADAGEIDLAGPGAELLFNITANTLISSLSALPDLKTPLTGVEAQEDLIGSFITGTTTPLIRGKITWKGLSGTQYTHRTQAVATVAITPASGYQFDISDTGITEAAIKGKFKAGSPVVALAGAPGSGKITVSLTYNITAMPIKTVVETDPETDKDISALFNLAGALKDPGLIVDKGLIHGQEAPTALRAAVASPYYSVDRPVVWKEGLSGKFFFGGYTAVAEVTLPAKPGYTFEGTNITNASLQLLFATESLKDLNGDGDGNGDIVPAVEITSAADSLVFTLSYNVPKTEITAEDVKKNVTPLPSPAVNTKPAASLATNKLGPIVDKSTVTWTGVSGASFASGQTPGATVTLVAKPGYEFAGDIDLNPADIAPGATAVGEANYGDKLVLSIAFTTGTVVGIGTDDLVLGALNLGVSFLHADDTVLGDIDIEFAGGTKIEPVDVGKSSFDWGDGLDGDGKADYALNGGKVNATVVLKAKPGYTFATAPVTNAAFKTKLAEALTIPGNAAPSIVDVSVDNDDLEINLQYAITEVLLTELLLPVGALNGFVNPIIGKTNVSQLGFMRATGTALVTLVPATPSPWSGDAVNATTGVIDGTVGKKIIYTFTLVPKGGYTFAGVSEILWNEIFDGILQDGEWDATVSGKNLLVTITWVNPAL